MTGIKPCAHCGGQGIDNRVMREGNTEPNIGLFEMYFYVECDDCGIRTGNYEVNDMQIDAWNKRNDR